MTLAELLAKWKGRYEAMQHMAQLDYGEDSPEKNKMIITMNNQLGYCIRELEDLLQASPLRRAMSKMVTAHDKSE